MAIGSPLLKILLEGSENNKKGWSFPSLCASPVLYGLQGKLRATAFITFSGSLRSFLKTSSRMTIDFLTQFETSGTNFNSLLISALCHWLLKTRLPVGKNTDIPQFWKIWNLGAKTCTGETASCKVTELECFRETLLKSLQRAQYKLRLAKFSGVTFNWSRWGSCA